MIISIIIFIYFLIKLIRNYRQGILIAFPLTLLFTTIPLIQIGNTHIGLKDAIFSVIYISLLFTKYRKDIKSNPLYIPLLCTLIGFTLTFIFGAYSSSTYIYWTNISNNILIPLAIWPILKNKEDIFFIIKSFCIIIFICCTYGIVEFILKENIWMYWLQAQTSLKLFIDHSNDIRFGFGRCNSFFHFPITFGDVCAIFAGFILFIKNNTINKTFNIRTLNIVLILAIIGVILSNSRASLIALIIIFFQIPFTKNKKYLFIGILIVICFLPFLKSVYASMFGNVDDSVGGSSVGMRNTQLLISFNEFLQHPLFGGGFNRAENLAADNIELMGAESQIFIQLIQYGLSGIIPYILTIIYMVKIFPSKYRRFPFFLTMSWISADIISLTTGITISYPIIYLLIVYRMYSLQILKN